MRTSTPLSLGTPSSYWIRTHLPRNWLSQEVGLYTSTLNYSFPGWCYFRLLKTGLFNLTLISSWNIYIYIIVGKSQSSFSSSTAWFLITSLQLPEKFHFKVVIIMRMKWSEVAQSCPPLLTLDCSLPGSSVHRIFQARVLEWVAISCSRGSSWPRDRTRVSRILGGCFIVWATREVHYENGNGVFSQMIVKYASIETW